MTPGFTVGLVIAALGGLAAPRFGFALLLLVRRIPVGPLMWIPVITCLSVFCVVGNWANGEQATVKGRPVPTRDECFQVARLALELAGATPATMGWFKIECERKEP